MLEIFPIRSACDVYIEKDNDNLIFVSDKLVPDKIDTLSHDYKNEKCFFKTPSTQKIEIAKYNRQQIKKCYQIMEEDKHCKCGRNPCADLLINLHEIFEANFHILNDPNFFCVIQIDKIYSILLGCLQTSIYGKSGGKTKLYLTTHAINHLTFNKGDIYETTN